MQHVYHSTKKRPTSVVPYLLFSALAFALFVGFAAPVSADFGAAPSNGGYVVDNGANLEFTVNASGDIRSCLYKGIQLVNPLKPSGIASGLGASSVNAVVNGNTIVITCISNTVAPSPFTHYYIVKNGIDTIFMADYVTNEPHIGELRYIFRGLTKVLPNGPPHSNNGGSTGNIESKDIFGHSDGTTTSKYYGNSQDRSLRFTGATGNGVGVFMAYGSRESSSGGPFYRDIENQGGGDQEIYNYMNSGHNQLEPHRVNVLYGPYAYVFTDGSLPAEPDFGFIADLGLTGYVGAAGRGQVAVDSIGGRNPAFEYTVGFASPVAQYWCTASQTDGSCKCIGMKPGTYDVTVYKGELAVWTGSVTVAAGSTTEAKSIPITDDPANVQTLWRIGEWDGTPLEFENGTLINQMHPSDVRMKPWNKVTFTVGQSPVNSWPAIQFRAVNSPSTIVFSLTAGEAAAAHTFKIGITDSYSGGRPDATINGSRLSPVSSVPEPKSRSYTTGSYRGYNHTFSWSIPSADFVAGVNTITISSFSGTKDLSQWLCPSFVYDCVELDD